jgi:hypothetical protein
MDKYRGLDYHKHDISHLGLIHGTKLWFFRPPSNHDDKRNHSKTTYAIQNAGDVVLTPRGYYHKTINITDWCLGVGGIGESPGKHYEVAIGDLDALRNLKKGRCNDAANSAGSDGGNDDDLDASLDVKTNNGKTIRNTACYHNRQDIIRWIVANKPGLVSVEDHGGRTPRDIARERGFCDVVAMLDGL